MTSPEPADPTGSADRQPLGRGRRLPWVAATAVLAACGLSLLYTAYHAAGPPPRPSAAAAVPIVSSSADAPVLSLPLHWPRATPEPPPPVDPNAPLLSLPLHWPRATPAATAPAAAPPAAPTPPAAARMRASTPTRIRIPSLDLSAPIEKVGLDENGGIEVPGKTRPDLAGWYQGGVTPGQVGTASIVGHVDTAKGPAVFYALGALARGARIEIEREDGTVAAFEVDGVEAFDKDDFPTARVFADATRPELRVVTCGGSFSRKTHYSGNVVAFAHLVP